MHFSISDIAWEAKDDKYMMDVLPERGCDGLEIAPTRIFPEKPYEKLGDAKDYAADLKENHGLTICSMQSIWYKRTESIFGSAEEVDALIEYTKQAILFAETVGCPNLVFGCPKNRIVPDGKTPDDALPFFREIGGIAADHGTTIALEAVPESYGTNFLNLNSDLYEYVKKADCRGLKMNLDFGTLITNGEDPADIARYVPLVNHVHISEDKLDCIKKRDSHKEFISALKVAGYDSFISIEMRNQGDTAKVLEIVDYIHSLL